MWPLCKTYVTFTQESWAWAVSRTLSEKFEEYVFDSFEKFWVVKFCIFVSFNLFLDNGTTMTEHGHQ